MTEIPWRLSNVLAGLALEDIDSEIKITPYESSEADA